MHLEEILKSAFALEMVGVCLNIHFVVLLIHPFSLSHEYDLKAMSFNANCARRISLEESNRLADFSYNKGFELKYIETIDSNGLSGHYTLIAYFKYVK